MSELDKLKLQINFHEKMFFVSLASLLAMLGWIANNLNSSSFEMLLLVLLSAFATVLFGGWHYRKIHALIDKVGDL